MQGLPSCIHEEYMCMPAWLLTTMCTNMYTCSVHIEYTYRYGEVHFTCIQSVDTVHLWSLKNVRPGVLLVVGIYMWAKNQWNLTFCHSSIATSGLQKSVNISRPDNTAHLYLIYKIPWLYTYAMHCSRHIIFIPVSIWQSTKECQLHLCPPTLKHCASWCHSSFSLSTLHSVHMQEID